MRLVRTLPLALLSLFAGCGGDSGTDPQPAQVVVQATAALSAPAAAEGAPSSIAITNGGDGTISGLTVSVAYGAGAEGWLTATLSGTDAPATLDLSAAALPLSGTYEATITVGSSGAGRAQVQVTLTVEPRPLFYMIDQQNDVLRRLDPATLQVTDVGPLGFDMQFGDCTFDTDGRQLLAIDGQTGQNLHRIDLATGAATLIGAHNVVNTFGLEYRSTGGGLYMTNRLVPRGLYLVDTASGAANLVVEVGIRFDGLAWDSSRGLMIAHSANVGPAGGQLYRLDLVNGIRTYLADTPSINSHSLAYDVGRDRIWAADVDGRLVEFDPAQGYAATSVATGLGQNICIVYVP
jgi:hypothetical protein